MFTRLKENDMQTNTPKHTAVERASVELAMQIYDEAAQILGLGTSSVDYDYNEQLDIRNELQQVIDAKSDRAAGNIVRWWGCWDRELTATKYARTVRQLWREWRKQCHD